MKTAQKIVQKEAQDEALNRPEFRKLYSSEVLGLKIGLKIMELRKKAGLSQKELAKRIGTTQQTISRLEDSRNTKLTLQTLAKIAAALDSELSIEFKKK